MGLDITGLGSAFDFAKGIMNLVWRRKIWNFTNSDI